MFGLEFQNLAAQNVDSPPGPPAAISYFLDALPHRLLRLKQKARVLSPPLAKGVHYVSHLACALPHGRPCIVAYSCWPLAAGRAVLVPA